MCVCVCVCVCVCARARARARGGCIVFYPNDEPEGNFIYTEAINTFVLYCTAVHGLALQLCCIALYCTPSHRWWARCGTCAGWWWRRPRRWRRAGGRSCRGQWPTRAARADPLCTSPTRWPGTGGARTPARCRSRPAPRCTAATGNRRVPF